MKIITVAFNGFMTEPPDATISSIISSHEEIIHFGGETCYLICIKEVTFLRRFFLISKKYVVTIGQITYRNLDDALEIAMTATSDNQQCYFGLLSREKFLTMTPFWPEFLKFISRQKVAQSKADAIIILARITTFMFQRQGQPKKRFWSW